MMSQQKEEVLTPPRFYSAQAILKSIFSYKLQFNYF